MNCTVGSCSEKVCGEIKQAIEAEVLAPFVRATISGANEITVGNKSCPDFGNKACILSFQYGQSNGCGCTIEIADEDGGVFTKFFDKMPHKMNEVSDKYNLEVEWGWIKGTCDGSSSELIKSEKHTFMLTKVDIKLDSIMKFTLTGTDLMRGAGFQGRNEKTYGTSDNPMKIKDAIRQLFKESNPPVETVEFYKRVPGGSPTDFEFKNDPKGVWHGNQQNALSSAMRWIRSFQTKDDKGVKATWDDTKTTPTIIFWEDTTPDCKKQISCNPELGTYIVNGGGCSPVINFTPKIQWNYSVASSTGGNVGKGTSKSYKQNDDLDCNLGDLENGTGSGTSTTNVTPETSTRTDGTKEASKNTNESDRKHARANRNYEPISAELTIQGDPSLENIIKLIGSTISIIVINPFHIQKGGGLCGEWLQASDCQAAMSNKAWMIQGVSHDIRGGSYTTTLSLFLATPGSTIDTGKPLGGVDGGYQLQ